MDHLLAIAEEPQPMLKQRRELTYFMLTAIQNSWHIQAHHPTLIRILIAIAKYELVTEFMPQWQANLPQAVQAALRLHLWPEAAHFLYLQSKIHHQRARLKPALASSRQAIRLLRLQPTTVLTLKIYVHYWALLSLTGRGSYQRLRQMALGMEKRLKRQAPSPEQHAEAFVHLYQSLAIFSRRMGGLHEAVHHMTRAIHHAQFAYNAPHLPGEAYRLRGLFAWAAEDYAQAEADLRCAIEMARAADNPLLLNFSRGNLGLVYWSQCKLSKAERETDYTVVASRRQQLAFQLLSQLGNAGLISLTQGRHQEAERRLRKQLKMAQERQIEYEIARSHGNLGLTYQSSGRPAEALPLLMTSWRLSKRARRVEALCAISINVSMCLAMLSRSESALRFARLALQLSERLNAPKFRLAALRAMAMIVPNEQARPLLETALTLAAERPFDRAACLFDLFHHAENPTEADRFYASGCTILRDIGAQQWVWPTFDPAAPPWLPALL